MRTPLLFNGEPTGTSMRGFIIEAQYEWDGGYLLVTSWDCPFDEMNEFTLLDHKYHELAHTSIGTLLVYAHWPVSKHALRVHFTQQICYTVSIELPSGHFRRRPRLKLTTMDEPLKDPRTQASMIELAKQLEDISTELRKTSGS